MFISQRNHPGNFREICRAAKPRVVDEQCNATMSPGDILREHRRQPHGNVKHVRGNQSAFFSTIAPFPAGPASSMSASGQRRPRSCQLLCQRASDAGACSGHHGYSIAQK